MSDMTKILADALVPIFAGLLLGYVAGLRRVMDNQNVRTLITFVMSFAVPCSMFLSIASTPRQALREQISTALLLAVVYIILYGLSFLWGRRILNWRASDSSVLALTLSFPNSAAVGLPLLASIYGPRSVVTVATSIAVGSITVSPMTLALLEADRGEVATGFSFAQLGLSFLRSFKRPIVWAPLLALLVSCLGLPLPSFVERSLSKMGTAAAGSALVLTGLVVSAQNFRFEANALLATFLKNALQPALALGIALFLRLPIEQTRFITLISAIPCGFFGVVFGKGFDSNPELASSSLIASYVTGVFTLAIWIAVVNHLH